MINPLGNFDLHEKLGDGRFGSVYRATDRATGQTVALKILAPDLAKDPTFAARFIQEARAAANMRHPNLVTVYAAGEQDGHIFLTMEYLPGGTLADRLRRARESGENGLPVAEAVRLLEETATGLAELHRRQIIHGDLSPSKILLDAEGHARLSGMVFSANLIPAHRLGIPAYTSPEQEQNTSYLRQPVDVYSLGVILYEMLTLRSFKREAPGTRLNAARPDAPGWLQRLLDQMLEKDPERRLWDGEKVLLALRAAQQDSHLFPNHLGDAARAERAERSAWPDEIEKQTTLQQDRARMEATISPPSKPTSRPPVSPLQPPPPVTTPAGARQAQPAGRNVAQAPVFLAALIVLAGLALALSLRSGPAAVQAPAATAPLAFALPPTATGTEPPAATETRTAATRVPPTPTRKPPTPTHKPPTPTRILPSPIPTEEPEQINFWNGNDLFQVNMDGSNLRKVIENAGQDCTRITWNQQGEYYAYVCEWENGVHICDVENREIKSLNSRIDKFSLVWSPDGTKFLNTGMGVQLVDAQSGETQRLNIEDRYKLYVHQLDWSFANGRVVLSTQVNIDGIAQTYHAMYLMTSISGQPILYVGAIHPFSNLSFSPDGEWIAYSTQRSAGERISVIRSDGSGQPKVVSQAGGIDPSWSPDGQWIIFSTYHGLSIVRPDGTGETQILEAGGRQVRGPVFRPKKP